MTYPDIKHAVIAHLRQAMPGVGVYGGTPDDITSLTPCLIVHRPPGPAPMQRYRWDTAAINIQAYAADDASAFALCSSAASALIDAAGKTVLTPHVVFNSTDTMVGVGENHDPNLPDFYRYMCTMIVRARKG